MSTRLYWHCSWCSSHANSSRQQNWGGGEEREDNKVFVWIWFEANVALPLGIGDRLRLGWETGPRADLAQWAPWLGRAALQGAGDGRWCGVPGSGSDGPGVWHGVMGCGRRGFQGDRFKQTISYKSCYSNENFLMNRCWSPVIYQFDLKLLVMTPWDRFF